MMKPFSAIYYIKENKKRAVALIILIATIAICYLGGLYVTSPINQIKKTVEINKDFVLVYQKSNNLSNKDFQTILDTAKEFDSVSEILNVNRSIWVCLNTVIGDQMTNFTVTCFKSTSDFKIYNNIVNNISSDCPLPRDGEIILSDISAKNLGVNAGDIIKSDDEILNNANRDYVVVGIFPSDDYCIYAVDETINAYGNLALRKDVPKQEIIAAQKNLENDFVNLRENHKGLGCYTYNSGIDSCLNGTEIFNMIYYAIVALISLVIVITINAIFSGAYEKRNYEFSVYKAIGFSKKEITRKIVREVMLINIAGIVVATLLLWLTVYLLNLFMLIPSGMYLSYFEWVGLLPTILCDILVVLSVIFKQTRKINKYDITKY